MPHIHKLIDFTVTPIIIHPDKNKILLVYHPRYDKWISVGGHIELDEDPEEALLREISEETGLEVHVLSEKPPLKGKGFKALFAPRFMDIHEANPPHKHIGMVYFCQATSENFIKSEEHTDMKWLTLSEIENLENAPSHIKYYAKQALGV